MAKNDVSAAVLRAMVKANRPMTATELSKLTSYSYNAVRLALAEFAQADTGYPTRYTLKERGEKAIDHQDFSESVAVPYVHYDDWLLARQEAVRKTFDNLRKEFMVTPETDPEKLYDLLHKAARVAASMAYDLQQVKHLPDWYSLMGGKIETLFTEE